MEIFQRLIQKLIMCKNSLNSSSIENSFGLRLTKNSKIIINGVKINSNDIEIKEFLNLIKKI